MEYKAKKKSGVTYFKEISIDWSKVTQKELKNIFDLGYTKFVTKEEDATEVKETKSKAKKSSKKSTNKK
tara:strand:+ start:552 stop:758 length:207 start_codon:yes stop_codon:yes gene_type:complete